MEFIPHEGFFPEGETRRVIRVPAPFVQPKSTGKPALKTSQKSIISPRAGNWFGKTLLAPEMEPVFIIKLEIRRYQYFITRTSSPMRSEGYPTGAFRSKNLNKYYIRESD